MPSWHYKFMIRNVRTQVHQISKVPACLEDGRAEQVADTATTTPRIQPIQIFGNSYSRPFLGLVSQPYFSNQCTNLLSHISCIRCQSSLSVLSSLFQPLYIWAVFLYPSWYNCMFPPRGVKWFIVAFPHAVTSTAIWCLQASGRGKTYIIRKANNNTKALVLRFSGWLFQSEKQ